MLFPLAVESTGCYLSAMTPVEMFPPILFTPQFSRDDVLAVGGFSAGVLKGILDRKQVTLQSEHNPGTGRRRMFSGNDVLKICTANVASNIGFPLRWAYLLADHVQRRAVGKLTGTALEPCNHFMMAFYPSKDGEDWAFVPVFDGRPASPLPIAYQVFDIDRIISETISKLTAVVNDEPLPSFDLPEIKAENPMSPENDFFEIWDKDDQGRDVRVGLTFEETEEYVKLEALWLADHSQPEDYEGPVLMGRTERDRHRELDKRHRAAHARRKFGETFDDESASEL